MFGKAIFQAKQITMEHEWKNTQQRQKKKKELTVYF